MAMKQRIGRRTTPHQNKLVVGAALVVAALVSCSPGSVRTSPEASPSGVLQDAEAVAGFEREFATIQRLRLLRLVSESGEACAVLDYRRGLFVSVPTDEFCGWIQDGEASRPRVRFDDQATEDLSAFLTESRIGGVSPRRISVQFAADGGILRGSFSVDSCRDYIFEPEWLALPRPNPGEALTAVNSDWFRISYCRA